jgi:hypothetical protein
MNKRINKIIPSAIKAIKEHMAKGDGLTIAAEYKGDISALSAGVVRSGLLPTLSFFSQHASSARDKEDTKSRRLKLMEAIKMLFMEHSFFSSQLKNNEKESFLFQIIRLLNKNDNQGIDSSGGGFRFEMNETKERIVKQELNEIAIAMKMAMRIFKNVKS